MEGARAGKLVMTEGIRWADPRLRKEAMRVVEQMVLAKRLQRRTEAC